MELRLDLSAKPQWQIGLTGLAGLEQCLTMILITTCYSVPLDSGFAHDGTMLDSPAPAEAARKISAFVKALRTYEPRIKVDALQFIDQTAQNLMHGKMCVLLKYHLADGVTL